MHLSPAGNRCVPRSTLRRSTELAVDQRFVTEPYCSCGSPHSTRLLAAISASVTAESSLDRCIPAHLVRHSFTAGCISDSPSSPPCRSCGVPVGRTIRKLSINASSIGPCKSCRLRRVFESTPPTARPGAVLAEMRGPRSVGPAPGTEELSVQHHTHLSSAVHYNGPRFHDETDGRHVKGGVDCSPAPRSRGLFPNASRGHRPQPNACGYISMSTS